MKGIREDGIRIGPLDVDLTQREIYINGEATRIGSRAFHILEILVRAGGQVVLRDDIIDRVWPDTVVVNNNLHVHMCTLRKLLGESRSIIKTIPGRGYTLVSNFQDPVNGNCGHCVKSGPKPSTRSEADQTGTEASIARQIKVIERADVSGGMETGRIGGAHTISVLKALTK
jgi:DNA-binding winged helix-turn-helix (wHTH) protein